jgi:hypothetical protein
MGIACRWCAFCLDDALAGREYVAGVISVLKQRRDMEQAREDAEQKAAEDHYETTGRVKFG